MKLFRIFVVCTLSFLCCGCILHSMIMAQDPVPVAQPKKKADDKKDDDKKKDVDPPPVKIGGETPPPAVAEPAGGAVLPINFVKNRVENMKTNAEGYVTAESMKVDGSRKCWIHPYALVGTKSTERVVHVRKTATGYHVTLDASGTHEWEAADFDPGPTKWLGVQSVSSK
jgi:hypothetical protein